MYDFKNNTNNNFSKQVSQEIMIKKILTTRAVMYSNKIDEVVNDNVKGTVSQIFRI